MTWVRPRGQPDDGTTISDVQTTFGYGPGQGVEPADEGIPDGRNGRPRRLLCVCCGWIGWSSERVGDRRCPKCRSGRQNQMDMGPEGGWGAYRPEPKKRRRQAEPPKRPPEPKGTSTWTTLPRRVAP